MKKLKNFNLLLILILLIAVGQITQTIYVPAIKKIAVYFNKSNSVVQMVMGTYLLFYGFSQLFYGPLSDRYGRRPVILSGLIIYLFSTFFAIFSTSLDILINSSALQGVGIGVAGVMARTIPRDLYINKELRYANSILNMGILVSPLLAPIIGGVIVHFLNWRAIYISLFIFGSLVLFNVWRWMPETIVFKKEKINIISSYTSLLSNFIFNAYLIILVAGLSGIVLFESSSGVLLGGVLGLNAIFVSIFFILPIPAAFLGSWYVGREGGTFSNLMWKAVFCCFFASIIMWLPGWFGFMNVWSLLIPASLFFFGAGMLFPLATTGAMEPFPYLAGSAGALIGGLQNVGSGITIKISASLSKNDQFSLGMLMFCISFLILIFWLIVSFKVDKNGFSK